MRFEKRRLRALLEFGTTTPRPRKEYPGAWNFFKGKLLCADHIKLLTIGRLDDDDGRIPLNEPRSLKWRDNHRCRTREYDPHRLERSIPVELDPAM